MSGLKYLFLFFSCIMLLSCSDKITGPIQQEIEKISEPIEPYPPLPSNEQYDYEKEEVALFLHFGMNTYTGAEWGDGKTDPKQFTPPNVT